MICNKNNSIQNRLKIDIFFGKFPKKVFRIPNSSLLLRLCHKWAGYRNNKGVKNMKNAFLKPLTMQLNMVWEPNSHISMLNMNQKFYICWRSGPRGPIPPLMMSRIDGKHCNSYTICLQARCKIYLYHKTFTFYDDSLSFLVWQFSFWYCIMIVANKLRGVVGQGLGRP